jgi:hypothetical protein
MSNEILAIIAISFAVTLAAGIIIVTIQEEQHLAFAKKSKAPKEVLRVKPVEGCFQHAFMRLYQNGV